MIEAVVSHRMNEPHYIWVMVKNRCVATVWGFAKARKDGNRYIVRMGTKQDNLTDATLFVDKIVKGV